MACYNNDSFQNISEWFNVLRVVIVVLQIEGKGPTDINFSKNAPHTHLEPMIANDLIFFYFGKIMKVLVLCLSLLLFSTKRGRVI
jgi:hypothetical protein